MLKLLLWRFLYCPVTLSRLSPKIFPVVLFPSIQIVCRIWSLYGGEDSYPDLLCYVTALSGCRMPEWRRNLRPSSSVFGCLLTYQTKTRFNNVRKLQHSSESSIYVYQNDQVLHPYKRTRRTLYLIIFIYITYITEYLLIFNNIHIHYVYYWIFTYISSIHIHYAYYWIFTYI
jgi:hypothetical protein